MDHITQALVLNVEKCTISNGSRVSIIINLCKCQDSFSGKMTDTIDIVPKCDVCDGIVKPDIVFFGEALPPTFFRNALVVCGCF